MTITKEEFFKKYGIVPDYSENSLDEAKLRLTGEANGEVVKSILPSPSIQEKKEELEIKKLEAQILEIETPKKNNDTPMWSALIEMQKQNFALQTSLLNDAHEKEINYLKDMHELEMENEETDGETSEFSQLIKMFLQNQKGANKENFEYKEMPQPTQPTNEDRFNNFINGIKDGSISEKVAFYTVKAFRPDVEITREDFKIEFDKVKKGENPDLEKFK